MDSESIKEKATQLLRRFYGYSSFRPMQLDVITSALNGRDSVVLMPTGGGKSICYQIPALMEGNGVTIVVSPLIALMKDQVTALLANGIPAAAVNSLMSEEENRSIMDQLFKGYIRILYISPERLLTEIDRWSEDLPISLVAVDEAHCISQWGHDFRPAYTGLRRIKELFPHVPVMALTATADRLTREDIAVQLALKNPDEFIGSFDRPNISLKVVSNPGKSRRISMICSMIDRYRDDSGMVYCLSRSQAEGVDAELKSRGYRSVVYHAGLQAQERNEAQERFINGDVQVVCATVAFGMGIDKSNIRWVVHNNMPSNIESYYQEIGRAGRDGVKAEAVMFYSYADVIARQKFVDESGRQAVNAEKLRRMQEFAESSLCRRRVLLSYFNETMKCDCGNCDVCVSPPERIDGTILAQKALSAIVRVEGRAGFTMIIDILRGSGRQDLLAHGYHKIKTYGAGRDLSFQEWNTYLSQFIQLGLIEIAYDENSHLKVTPYGVTVLRGETPVMVAKYHAPEAGRRRKSQREKGAAILSPAEMLLSALKEVRLKLARKEMVPPYIVFSDKVLLELVRVAPVTMEEFAGIEGVGQRKAVKYWKPFVTAIRKFKGIKESLGRGLSHHETLLLLNAGYSIEEIASAKGIKPQTVYNHIAALIDEDKIIEFSSIITREQYLRVMSVVKEHPDTFYEILSGELPRGLPKVALAISDFLLRRKANDKK